MTRRPLRGLAAPASLVVPVLAAVLVATLALAHAAPARAATPLRLAELGVTALDPQGTPATGAEGPLLLQFWASSCRSCGKLMWDLDAVAARHPQVPWLAVSIDEVREDARAGIRAHPLYLREPARWLHDGEGRLAARLGITVTPTVLVLDGHGTEVLRHVGHLNAADLQRLHRVLAEQSDDPRPGDPAP